MHGSKTPKSLTVYRHIIQHSCVSRVTKKMKVASNHKWRIQMSCDETERSWMNCFRRFGISFIFKVMHSVIGLLDTEDDDETSEMYPSTRRHIPEDLNLSSSTPTRTSNLPKNKLVFTMTLHFSVLKILPDVVKMTGILRHRLAYCSPAIPPVSLPQLNLLSYRGTIFPVPC